MLAKYSEVDAELLVNQIPHFKLQFIPGMNTNIE